MNVEPLQLGKASRNCMSSLSRQRMDDPLSNFCRRLFLNRNQDQYATCKECGKKIKVFVNSGCLRMRNLIAHVCQHLGKVFYTCRYCKFDAVTVSRMANHLIQSHKLSRRKEYYDDLTANCYENIKDMVKRCFGLPE